jgi:PAS domain S-box-containing protein
LNDVPDIIKQLREEERLQKDKNLYLKAGEENKPDDELDEASGSTTQLFKREESNIDISSLDEKYLNFLDNCSVAIIIVDEDEHIILWNEHAEKLFNLTEEELSLRHISSLYKPDEWEKIQRKNIKEKPKGFKIKTKMIKKNKGVFDAEISFLILRGPGGKTTGSVTIVKELNDSNKHEKTYEISLKSNEEKYRRLFNNSPDMIAEMDENGVFVSANTAMCKSLGVSADELIGKNIFEVVSKEAAEKRAQLGKQLIKTGKMIEIDDERDGRVFHNIFVPYNDSNGNKFIQVIARDITKEKKAEQELKKSEKRYRSLFETAIYPILILDTNGVFIDVNNRVIEKLEYTKDELIGNKFIDLEILDEKSSALVLKNFKKRISGKKVPPYEVRVISKNGKIIPVEINASPIFDNEKIIGDLVILRDLSERYQKEYIQRELLESEKKFKDIFDSTSDIMLYLEKDIILDINKSASDLFGFKKEELIGKKLSFLEGVLSSEGLERHYDAVKDIIKGNDVSDYETKIITKNGTIFRFLFSADCIRNEQEIKGILIQGKDITQRQRAWDELVKLEERYRVLAETSADGVITIDPLGRLTYVNPSFEKMCKRRKSQILATLFRNYLSDDSVYFFQQIFIDVRKKDEKIENVELELVHPDENTIPIEVNIAPIKKKNEFAGMVCTIRDITERRRIEDELKKSERLKTEFMNIAAHELKSPVTPIKGYLDLIINDSKTSEQVKEWAKISLRNSERLLRLVNDILDVSRLDTDTMKFDMEKLNSVDILDEIVEDMKPVVENKKLKFNSKIPRDLPNIMGDKYRLSQVLKNLLVNAIKFTDHGSISVEALKKKDNILIAVKDTGVGISKDEVNKVFSKFYQAYTGDDRKNEGTGLGLFICKEIIQKHNGKIWVESKIGEGSQFYVRLPYIHKMVVDLKK